MNLFSHTSFLTVMIFLFVIAPLNAAENTDDDDCTAARAEAAFSPNKSKFKYTITREGHSVVETLSKVPGYELTVDSGGCVDAVGIDLTFRVDEKDFPKQPAEQLAWVKERVKEANCTGDRCYMLDRALSQIAKHLDKIKVSKAGALATSDLWVCHDNKWISRTDDECDFKNGGSSHFQVKRSDKKGKVELVLSDAVIL